MGGITLAWAAGMGIIIYRAAGKEHRPPVPGQMLAATGLFAMAALLAEYQPARTAATLFAFGVDIAVLMQVLPGAKTPPVQTAAKKAAGKGPGAGTTQEA
jgi:hypothetical protein